MTSEQQILRDDLSDLGAVDIDALPFGYIALAPDGTVRKYNRYEADLAGTDPHDVLGKSFFREVAPCTQVREFEGRFRAFADGELEQPSLAFDFEFRFRHGTQKVRIGLVRSPLDGEIIVTVNRKRDLDLALSPEIAVDPVRGVLERAPGDRVIAAGADLWRSLDRALGGIGESGRKVLFQTGLEWGVQHALRIERLVQREHGTTLCETELQAALEVLSGSLGMLGLGAFDLELGYRRQGLLLVQHRNSPFAAFGAAERDGAKHCDLLAGLHAGFLSYLSGRRLTARETACSHGPDEPCRFVVGTEPRLERLFDAPEGSRDRELLELLDGGRRPEHEGAVRVAAS